MIIDTSEYAELAKKYGRNKDGMGIANFVTKNIQPRRRPHETLEGYRIRREIAKLAIRIIMDEEKTKRD